MPGGTLKKFLVELLRNFWRNSGEIGLETAKEFMGEKRKKSWGNCIGIPEQTTEKNLKGTIKEIQRNSRWSAG